MIAYLDTSVLLRWVLDSPDQLSSTEELAITRCLSSELLEIEGFRALDALRLRRGWTRSVLASRRARLVRPALPERLIGSIRRESVDHIGVLGEALLCMPNR